jgi:hypothetical protein
MYSIVRLTTLAGIMTAAFWMGGCVAVTYVQVPAIQGRVVNAQGQPMPNAVVHVVRDSDKTEVAAIPSQPDGTFHRAEQSRFAMQFAGADRIVTKYSVTATAGEQRSAEMPVCDDVRMWYVWFAWDHRPPTREDLGELRVR